jgi:hypothetical protein
MVRFFVRCRRSVELLENEHFEDSTEMQVNSRFILGLVAITVLAGCTAPPQPTTTVWHKLGVPQNAWSFRDNWINRTGNHPKLERKPKLLRLADPANLESPVPAIEVGAKVKQQEDLKDQKIKAIKYLAEMGCGCYNDDGEIEAALLDALNDCTPEVRQAAAEAIAAAAGTCNCCYDGCTPTCCGEKIQEQLMDMAYGENDGCWKEPSPEVRAAAAAAVAACPAQRVAAEKGPALEEGGPSEEGPTPADPAVPLPAETQARGVAPKRITNSPFQMVGNSYEFVPVAISQPEAPKQSVAVIATTAVVEQQKPAEQKIEAPAPQPITKPAPASHQPIVNPELLVKAQVVDADAVKKQVTIAFEEPYALQRGTKLVIQSKGTPVVGIVLESNQGLVTLFVANGSQATSIGTDVSVGMVAQ